MLINAETVEPVEEYKYLGAIMENKFNFSSHMDRMYKKANSRMLFVRILPVKCKYGKVMDLFYSNIMQSVFSFAICC